MIRRVNIWSHMLHFFIWQGKWILQENQVLTHISIIMEKSSCLSKWHFTSLKRCVSVDMFKLHLIRLPQCTCWQEDVAFPVCLCGNMRSRGGNDNSQHWSLFSFYFFSFFEQTEAALSLWRTQTPPALWQNLWAHFLYSFLSSVYSVCITVHVSRLVFHSVSSVCFVLISCCSCLESKVLL